MSESTQTQTQATDPLPQELSLASLISESPTSYHAAEFIADYLQERGCKFVDITEPFPSAPGSYVMVQDGAVAAWVIPAGRDTTEPLRFNIVAGHTDSPAFKLKPHADHVGPAGFNQLAVEIYGGMLPNSWLDRELGIAGRIVDVEGNIHLVRIDDICRIPQLAVHLDREAAQTLTLDRQEHLRPIWGIGAEESIFDLIAQVAELGSAEEILSHDLFLFPSEPPATIGVEGEMLAAGRQDNLATMYSATAAFAQLLAGDGAPDGVVPMLIGFDHEEIGSQTMTGAGGPLLRNLLHRIAAACEVSGAEFDRSLANSVCLSSDVAHSVHPNYASKHDVDHWPVLGGGPVLKVNANQRYATDAIGSAEFAQACAAAGVSFQVFASNNDVPCGSTIGPITATRLGIRTVDVGAPLLSMHSARELTMLSDHEEMAAVMLAWWENWE